MTKLLNHPQVKPLLCNEHFSVDGTLIEAWASHKSFRPKDGSDDDDGTNFHKQKRTNETPREHDQSGQTALSQSRRTRGEALVYGARHHGEPQRVREMSKSFNST